MNEQQLADLFAAQLDNFLAGQPAATAPQPAEFSELFSVARQLSDTAFQPGPAAQAAFQAQLAAWGVGATAAATAGISKLLWWSLAALVAGGAALGGQFAREAFFKPQATPAATVAPTSTPQPAHLPVVSTAAPTTPPQPLREQLPTATYTPPRAGQGESLPTSTPAPPTATDTLTPEPSPLPTATAGIPGSGITNTGSNGGTSSGLTGGDHDRGHGNDPGGYDPDNPGNSSGVPDNGGGQGSDRNPGKGNKK